MTEQWTLSFVDDEGESKLLELPKRRIRQIVKEFKKYNSFILTDEEGNIIYYHPKEIKVRSAKTYHLLFFSISKDTEKTIRTKRIPQEG